jgi:hypothetical protein
VIFALTYFIITFVRFNTLNFYNGISYFLFAYIPFSFVIILQEFKNNTKYFLKNIYNELTIFVLIAVFILYPIYFSVIDSIFSEKNLQHLISMILGVVFLSLWEKRFYNSLTGVNQNTLQKRKSSRWDQICRTMGYLITVINFLALLIVLKILG